MDKVDRLRNFSGWVLRGLASQPIEVARTHLVHDEEYWLALRHPAEVASAGRALLAQSNPAFSALSSPDQDASWREFRAYIRQAEGFYRGACVLPWKSSPLNYYYAFMNLAKAMAVARGLLPPQQPQQPRVLRHGLSARVVPGAPDSWKLIVQRPADIFSQLYQMAIGTTVAEHTEFDARALLKYVSPIAWQLYKSGYTPMAWYPSYWVIALNQTESWDILGVPREAPLDRLPPSFDGAFQEVSPEGAKNFAWHNLKLHAEQANNLRFLERKVPIPSPQPMVLDVGVLQQTLKATAPYCVFDLVSETEHQLGIAIPYRGVSTDIPMNELVACYALMFFLSSLVRYHPDYMDAIGESSDAWLIESFAKSVPLFLLRYLTSGVLQFTLIIESV